MKFISLKNDDKIIEQFDISRNYHNKIQINKLFEKILKKESSLVSKESIKVLKEFENIERIDWSV